jgi:16S rRNA processing protein RimM
LTTPEQWVWLALIRRTQGRKGEVFADILTDFPEKFVERQRLWLVPSDTGAHLSADAASREVELVGHWLHKGGIVLHFAGVNSISDAEKLAGLAVTVPRDERATLEEDEVYVGDLIGCTLIDVADKGPVIVGKIEGVDRTAGPVALLIVQSAEGREVLIPFAKSYLRRVDISGKRVEMELPEGLADLNS